MATPLTREELDFTKGLIQEMQRRGKTYDNLSPKGKSLIDRYRAQPKQQPTTAATEQPAAAPGPAGMVRQAFGLDKPYVSRGARGAISQILDIANLPFRAAGGLVRNVAELIPATRPYAERAGQIAEVGTGLLAPAGLARAAVARTAAVGASKLPAARLAAPAGRDVSRVNITNSLEEMMGKVLGPEWADRAVRARTLSDRIRGTEWQKLRQLGVEKLSDAEDLTLRMVLEGKAAVPRGTLTPRVQAIARAFSDVARRHADEFDKAGRRIWDPSTKRFVPFERVEHYAPRVLDYQKLEKISMQQLIQDIQATNPQVSGNNILELAGSLKGIVLGRPPLQLTKRVQQGLGPMHLKTRGSLELPPSIMESMKTSIPRYLDDASREIAVLPTFGSNDKAFMQAIYKTGHQDAEALWNAYARWRKWEVPTGLGKQMGDVGRLSNNIAAIMFLKYTTAVKQISQLVPLWAKSPTKDMATGFLKMFRKGNRLEAERAGAFTNDLASAAYGALSGRAGPGAMGKALAVTAKGAEKVVKYTGTGAVDRFVRGVAYFTKKSELDNLVKYGTEAQIKRANISQLGARSMTEAIEMAAKEFADKVNLRTDIVSSPVLTTHPMMQFMRGLNMFTIQNSKMLYKEFIKPTFHPESLRAWSEQIGADAKYLIGGALVGEVINDAIAVLTNKRRPQHLVWRAAENLAVINSLGVLNPITMGLFREEPLTAKQALPMIGRNITETAKSALTGAGPAALTVLPESLATGDKRRFTRAVVPIAGDIVSGHLFPRKEGTRQRRQRRQR